MSENEGLAAVAAAAAEGVQASAGSVANNKPEDASAPSAPESAAKPDAPDAMAALAAGVTAGGGLDADGIRQAERGRILALDAMALPGCESIIEAAKTDGTSPEKAALEMVKHLKATNALVVSAALASAAETVPEIGAGASDPVGAANAAAAVTPAPNTEEGWKKAYAASTDLQAEFGSEGAYIAFQKNSVAGRVNIYKGGK